MRTLTEHALEERRREEKINDPGTSAAERRALETGVHSRVVHDIKRLFHGKTYNQLLLLRDEIERRIRDGAAVDVGYWETLLKFLQSELARARLRELHQTILQRKLSILREQQMHQLPTDDAFELMARAAQQQEQPEDAQAHEAPAPAPAPARVAAGGASAVPEVPDVEPAPELPLLAFDHMEEDGTMSRDAQADDKHLTRLRRAVLAKIRGVRGSRAGADRRGADTADTAFQAEASRKMDADEEAFNIEASLPVPQVYQWADKYRPRKPRYFNRVHTVCERETEEDEEQRKKKKKGKEKERGKRTEKRARHEDGTKNGKPTDRCVLLARRCSTPLP